MYCLNIATGQRGPFVANIFGENKRFGTVSSSPVLVLEPLSIFQITYSLPFGPSSFCSWRSPSLTRWCSSRALQPKWRVLLNQTVLRRDCGDLLLNCSVLHSLSICSDDKPRALFGLCPFPWQRSCLRLLAKASLAFANCLSVRMSYVFPCCRKKRSKLRKNEVSVSSSYSSPFCFRILITKWASMLSRSLAGISSMFLFSLIDFAHL